MKPKRLIFTVTTGRSGTEFLTYQLGLLKNIISLHEPAPGFESIMRESQFDRSIASKFLLEQKLPFIENQNAKIYIETSHVFCKGFLEPLIDLGYIPDLIILRRDIRSVSKSLYKLNTIPGRTELGLKYYLSPDDPANFIKLKNWKHLDDYQISYWYCLEIEERMKVYSKLIDQNGGKTIDINFDDLISFKSLVTIREKLNLPAITLIGKLKLVKRNILRKQINPKTHLKNRPFPNYDFTLAEKVVKGLISPNKDA
jgi:hypothetical protein